jgi:proteasome accessory factor B
MPKQTYITRYLLIINRLKKSPASFEQIKNYLLQQSEIRGLDYSLEKRTFQREISEIRELFALDIYYDRSEGAYKIREEEGMEEQSLRLVQAYEMLDLVRVSAGNSEAIIFESRRPDGLQHFYDLLSAIKNCEVISISYQKFYEDEPCTRTLQPLALKESRGRWYLIARSSGSEFVAAYGLDRIKYIAQEGVKFKKPAIDVQKLYAQSFGIIRSEKAEKVVLSFTEEQGKYIKSYPLHSSQTEVPSRDGEYVVQLNIHVTHDFIMELLSYGSEVHVLSPATLRKRVKQIHLQAATVYND